MYPITLIEPPVRPAWDDKLFEHICNFRGQTYEQIIKRVKKTLVESRFYICHSEIHHNIIEGMTSKKYEFDSDFEITIFKTDIGYEIGLKNLKRKLPLEFIESCFKNWTKYNTEL